MKVSEKNANWEPNISYQQIIETNLFVRILLLSDPNRSYQMMEYMKIPLIKLTKNEATITKYLETSLWWNSQNGLKSRWHSSAIVEIFLSIVEIFILVIPLKLFFVNKFYFIFVDNVIPICPLQCRKYALVQLVSENQ
jgi:hypothetical protein